MSDSDKIKQAAEALKRGELVIIPTDTVYGVAASPWVESAAEALYEAKGRDKGKPIPMLASEISAVEKYGAKPGELARKLANKYWPGPLTIVMEVHSGGKEACFEGFRVPDCELARELLKKAGGILRVTSANLSGDQPALTAEAAREALGDSVGFVLDGGQSPGGEASSVVKIEDGKLEILREGAVSEQDLLATIS